MAARFTLKQLAYFVAAGDAGSITLASERVPISQPSISAAISALEHEFGVPLFVRHHAQGLSPTPAGEALLDAARALLRGADDLAALAHDIGAGLAGPLRVGAFRTLSPLLLPDLVAAFARDHPRVELTLVEDDEAELAARLRRGAIDLAISYAPLADDIDFEPLAPLPTYALLAAGHRLAGADQVTLADLAPDPFLLLDLPVSRDWFASLFQRAGLVMRAAARSDQPETIRAMVGAGLGWSLMTARPAALLAANGRPLAYVPLAGDAAPMQLGLLLNPALRPTRAALAFADFCRSTIRQDHLPGMAQWEALR